MAPRPTPWRPRSRPTSYLKHLAMLATVANAVLLAVALNEIGAFLMSRKFIILAAVAAAALALSACGTLSDGSGSAVAAKALENLEHCKRTYQASVGALGAPGGSLYIECPARPFDGGPAIVGSASRPDAGR